MISISPVLMESNIPLLKSEFDRWEVEPSQRLGWVRPSNKNKLRPKWSRRSVEWMALKTLERFEWHKGVLENQIYIWLELFGIPKNGWVTLERNSWSRSFVCHGILGEFVVLSQQGIIKCIWHQDPKAEKVVTAEKSEAQFFWGLDVWT